MWEPQLKGLSYFARIIAPDVCGFGESEYTQGPYSMDMLAGDLHEFLNEIDIREPVILGRLSMGEFISFAFCRLYPDRVAGLLLAATPDNEQEKVTREERAAVALEVGPKPIIEDYLTKLIAPNTYQEKPTWSRKFER
jgi:pimeloyl-ACP methyl ester carboxylesterase